MSQIEWKTPGITVEQVKFRSSYHRATDQSVNSKIIYAYKNMMSSFMRRQGFAFRPVFRDNLKEPSHRRCDYKMSVDITDRHMKIEINL